MSVDVHGNLDGVVTELISYIRQGFPILDQQACVGMADIVDADVAEVFFSKGYYTRFLKLLA